MVANNSVGNRQPKSGTFAHLFGSEEGFEYLAEVLQKEVKPANPLSQISFPPQLSDSLRIMGPRYAIALGLALGGLK